MKIYAAVQEGFSTRNPSLTMDLQVCGAFSEGIYIKSSDHKMFLIHDFRYGLIPFGFAIPNAKTFLERYEIKVGMKLIWKDPVLYFPEIKAQIVVEEKEVPALSSCRPDKDTVMRTVRRGIEILRKSSKGSVKEILWNTESETINDIYMRKAFLPLKKLENGMKNEDASEINTALYSLLGLGPGLTPSMDDFLTAVLVTCIFIERCWRTEITGAEILADQVKKMARERTGEFSAAYLTAAADGGRFSLLECLLSNDSNLSNYETLLEVGGNSGADQLTGVIWSMLYILKQLEMTQV